MLVSRLNNCTGKTKFSCLFTICVIPIFRISIHVTSICWLSLKIQLHCVFMIIVRPSENAPQGKGKNIYEFFRSFCQSLSATKMYFNKSMPNGCICCSRFFLYLIVLTLGCWFFFSLSRLRMYKGTGSTVEQVDLHSGSCYLIGGCCCCC